MVVPLWPVEGGEYFQGYPFPRMGANLYHSADQVGAFSNAGQTPVLTGIGVSAVLAWVEAYAVILDEHEDAV
ncbi:MAG: hypothetical protein L0Z70_13575, partial [Chloroflexi bacterium]|nr:hypothetical protein [Chloroflexota bacterium]